MPTYAPEARLPQTKGGLSWNPEQAERNLERILDFQKRKVGIFSLPDAIIHPQLALPDGVVERTREADIYRLFGAMADKRTDAMEIWWRTRDYFNQHGMADIDRWSQGQADHFLAQVNPLLLKQATPPEVLKLVPWYDRFFAPFADKKTGEEPPMSGLAASLRAEVMGMGPHLSRVAIQYLAEPRDWDADPEYMTKVDSNDGWLSWTSRELLLDKDVHMPNHSLVNAFVACRLAETAEKVGANKLHYKAARWALMARHVKTYVYGNPSGSRTERANTINSIYEGFFGSTLERWAQSKYLGHYEHSDTIHLDTQLVDAAHIDVKATLPKLRGWTTRGYQAPAQERHPDLFT